MFLIFGKGEFPYRVSMTVKSQLIWQLLNYAGDTAKLKLVFIMYFRTQLRLTLSSAISVFFFLPLLLLSILLQLSLFLTHSVSGCAFQLNCMQFINFATLI